MPPLLQCPSGSSYAIEFPVTTSQRSLMRSNMMHHCYLLDQVVRIIVTTPIILKLGMQSVQSSPYVTYISEPTDMCITHIQEQTHTLRNKHSPNQNYLQVLHQSLLNHYLTGTNYSHDLPLILRVLERHQMRKFFFFTHSFTKHTSVKQMSPMRIEVPV